MAIIGAKSPSSGRFGSQNAWQSDCTLTGQSEVQETLSHRAPWEQDSSEFLASSPNASSVDSVESGAYFVSAVVTLVSGSAAARPCRLAVLQGVMAMTRRGLPEPPTIFSGAATTMAPVGGS